MLVKIVLLFLVAMGVVAMIGRFRFPGALAKQVKLRPKTCPKCGRHRIGVGECPCGNKV